MNQHSFTVFGRRNMRYTKIGRNYLSFIIGAKGCEIMWWDNTRVTELFREHSFWASWHKRNSDSDQTTNHMKWRGSHSKYDSSSTNRLKTCNENIFHQWIFQIAITQVVEITRIFIILIILVSQKTWFENFVHYYGYYG